MRQYAIHGRYDLVAHSSTVEAVATYIHTSSAATYDVAAVVWMCRPSTHCYIRDYDVAGVGPPAASGSAVPLDLRLRLSNPSLTSIIPVANRHVVTGWVHVCD